MAVEVPNRIGHVESGDGPERFIGPKSQGLVTFVSLINAATHILIGAVAISAFMYANAAYAVPMRLHIYFCVFGYVILMGQGILSICPHAGWARTLSYNRRKQLHLSMQAIGSVLAIIGSIIKIADQGSNFRFTHGILGVVAMIFTFLTLIGGLFQYLVNVPAASRIIHFVCGSLTMVLVFLALIFAFKDYAFSIAYYGSVAIPIVASVFCLIGILFSSTINTFKMLI